MDRDLPIEPEEIGFEAARPASPTTAGSLKRDVAINTVGNVALAVAAIASGSIISYRYDADGRGVIGVASVVAALSASVGSMGLGDALLYAVASKRTVDRRVLIVCSLAGSAGAGLLATIAAVIVSRFVEIEIHRDRFVLFCGLVGAATAFYLVPAGALRGTSRFLRWNVLRVAATSVWAVALLAGGSSSDLRLDVIAIAYASALAVIGAAAIFQTLPGIAAATSPERLGSSLRFLVLFGLPSAFASAPLLLNARVDQLALGFVTDGNTVGQYVAAAGYCWATVPLVQAISNLTSTRVAAQSSDAQRAAAIVRLTNVGVSAVVGSTILAWVAAPLALRVLNGPGFGDSVGISRVLLIGAGLQGVSLLLEEGARGLGRPRLALYSEIVGLSVIVVLLVVLARHGTIQTALATVTGNLVTFVVIVAGVCRFLEVRPAHLLRPLGFHELKALARVPSHDQ